MSTLENFTVVGCGDSVSHQPPRVLPCRFFGMSHASVIFREQKISSNGSSIFNSKKQFQLNLQKASTTAVSCHARGLKRKESSTVAGSDDAPSE
jgi:hypothetical protein